MCHDLQGVQVGQILESRGAHQGQRVVVKVSVRVARAEGESSKPK